MYCNLHVHDSKGSLLDSIITVQDMVKFAKQNNQPAIACTNHGLMTSYVDFWKECKKENIKPIIGCEIYEVDDMFEKADTKDYKQERFHLVLLAKNKIGFKNLLKIVSVANTEGFYKKPLVSISYIKENGLGKGIVCLTACQAGRLSRLLCLNKNFEAKNFIKNLKSTFDYVVCEIQSHDTIEQISSNIKIIDFAKKNNLPFTVTSDAHMINKDEQKVHSIFIQIGEDREVGESYTDCYLQTEKDVTYILSNSLFSNDVQAALKENNNIVNMIEEYDIGVGQENQMPIVNIEDGFSSHEEYLRYLVYKDFDTKFAHLSEKEKEIRKQRLETELPVLFELEYTDYFIMLYMLIQEAKKRNIPLGYSRGSGANCLCLFMIGVTQIDSVKWDLDFSRFANLGRKSLADYDMDISKRRRKELIQIAEDLFGKENVAPIATFNTLSTKVAIRDIGKVLNDRKDSEYYQKIPYSVRDEVAKAIPTVKTLDDLGESQEKDVLLKEILYKSDKLKAIYEEFPLWFEYVMRLEGLPKSIGRHAAGTLITPKPVVEYCPLCYDKEKNIMVQLEMHNAMDDLGCIKMDFLGLESLDIIDDTLKMAQLTWDDIDINHLDLEDEKVYKEVYQTGNTIGVFQFESAEARKMCIDAQANNIEDIIAINAANRPATKDSFPTYCKNKLFPNDVELLHEDLRDILGKTNFILLYQEQALQLFRYAGFPEEEVDNARRCIGKKLVDKMKILEKDFKKGLKNKGWNETQRNSMWDLILKQSTYSFNRGHSTAYGLLSYLTAYLKVHYPIYYLSACLSSKSDKIEKISIFVNECKRLGINVIPPNVNYSGRNFTPNKDNNEILFGLLAVKGLGERIINKIIEMRPYKNFKDFIEKIDDKSAIITLIKSGSLPSAKNKQDKMRLLKKYADSIYSPKAVEPVVTLPSRKKLKEEWGIDDNLFKNDKGIVDVAELLAEYNIRRTKKIEKEKEKNYQANMKAFYEKYAQDEYLWEFQTLSMFLTDNPLENFSNGLNKDFANAIEGEEVSIISVIIDIKRKKDKHGNLFAYLDLYTTSGIIEATIWSAQLREYIDLIKKGACLAMYGRKKENHFFVKEVEKLKDEMIKKF